MAKETAEQKLLRLIEAAGGEGAGESQAAETPQPAEAGAQALESVRSTGISMPPFVQGIITFTQSFRAFGLKEVNKILVGCIVFVAAFFVFDFIKGRKESMKDIQFIIQKNVRTSSGDSLPVFKDLTEYANAIKERNIFHPFEKKIVKETDVPAGQQRITEKIADFKLVGVSWLDSPESVTVMIEDEKTSITHFLKEGEEFKGVKIDTIYADSVILSYDNETITINL